MIVGVGTDIVDIYRIENAINNNSRFIERFFTHNEIAMFKARGNKSEIIAGNFSAKEAVSKSLGTGIRGFTLKDIEILRDEYGKPYVVLHNGSKDIANRLNILRFHVSISHDKTKAISYVVAEND